MKIPYTHIKHDAPPPNIENFYEITEIDITRKCCDNMCKQLNIGTIRLSADTRFQTTPTPASKAGLATTYREVHYDYHLNIIEPSGYADGGVDDLVPIDWCPFCGERIEYVKTATLKMEWVEKKLKRTETYTERMVKLSLVKD